MDTRSVITPAKFGAFILIAVLTASCSGGDDSTVEPNPCPGNCAVNSEPKIQWTDSSQWQNKTVSGSSVSLHVWSLMTTTGTEKVEFFVDSSLVAPKYPGAKMPGIPELEYIGFWDTTNFSDGPHTIIARVTDKIGRIAETSGATTTIANNVTLSFAMTPGEELPATASTATGTGQLAMTWITGAISGEVTLSGMTASAVEIRDAYAGTAGSNIMTLVQDTSNPNRWVIPPDSVLDLGQKTRLQSGALYVNAASAAYPFGEVRAQLQPNNIRVVFVNLTGAQEVPSVSTASSGIAAVTLDTKLPAIIVHVRTTGLDTTSTVGSYFGTSTMNGTMFAQYNRDFSQPGHWYNSSSLSANGISLLDGGWYINVTNAANPSGELRGQVPPITITP